MANQLSVSTYRRRILGVGAVVALVLFIVGAIIVNNRIEDDLETQVPDRLTSSGFDISGATISFSGQNGTMECDAPLDDAVAVQNIAYEVWGVHSFELDRSCRTNTTTDDAATDTSPTTSTGATTTADTGTNSTTTDPSADAESPTTTDPTDPQFDTVAQIVKNEYQTLNSLIGDTDLTETLTDVDAHLTVLAPTDAAFAALPNDQSAVLQSSPELLAQVLTNHVVDGALSREQLEAAESVQSLAGNELAIVIQGDELTIAGSSVKTGPIQASNGVVYGIDTLIIPDGVDLTPQRQPAAATATYADNTIVLNGVVATEAERATLATAATEAVGSDAVTDNLQIDAEVGLSADNANSLSELITAMEATLVNGEAGFDGESLFVNGQYATEDDATAMTQIAEALGATTALEQRPAATDTDAAQVETELNAFVTENPILFEPGSENLIPSAIGILERIAAQMQQFGGINIEVQGHTDSDGATADNQALSEARAASVRTALIELGVDAAQLSAVGFGEDQLITVDGTEDKSASRRVVFDVTVSNN